MKYRFTAFLILLLSNCGMVAQLSIDAMLLPYQINFDASVGGVSNSAFSASGLVPAPIGGQLDSDAWAFSGVSDGDLAYGGIAISPDYTRGVSAGGVTTGGIYAFEGGSIIGRSLGFQPAGSDFVPGNITLRALNNTGTYITSIDLSYTVHVNNDQPRGNSLNFSFSQDGTQFHPVPTLDLTSLTLPDGLGFVANPRSTLLDGIYVPDGNYFYLRWESNDALVGGGGSRDEFSLDDISVTAQTESPLIFYTQNSGNQSTSINTATQLWATSPVGQISYKQFPLIPTATYIIQTSHTTTLTASTSGTTINHLTLESGATLLSTGGPNSPKYMALHGDITCNGTIGNGSGIGSGIAFNFEPGDHLISGAGTFDCSRIRKSNINGLSPTCNLTFDMDVQLHYSDASGTAIYNDRSSSVNNNFNVTINSGVVVNVTGDVSLDGTNGDNGFLQWERGGTLLINGTLNCDTIFHKTDNLVSPCSIVIGTGGLLNCNGIEIGSSGAGGFSSTVMLGGQWKINGSGSPWANFSSINNTVDFQPGSNCTYDNNSAQNINSEIDYATLSLVGSGIRSIENIEGIQDGLSIQDDLLIGATAVLNGDDWTINVGRNWSMNNALGFNAGTSNVVFNGLAVQGLFSPAGAVSFYNLTMNNVIENLYLYKDISISNAANFINGEIYPNAYAVIFEDGALVNGASNASFVNGIVRKIGSQNFTFPVGKMGDYRPISISNLSESSTFEASYYFGDPNAIFGTAKEITIDHISTCEYWILDRLSGGSTTVDLTWDQDICGTSVTNYITSLPDLTVARWDGGIWLDEGNTATSGTTAAGSISSNTISNFSPITLASKTTENPLPITLISFTAEPVYDAIKVNWVTASELNNDYFELLKQDENGNLISQVHVPGAGESSHLLEYSWLDYYPFEGINIYYLRQVDFNGTDKIYGPISANHHSDDGWSLESVVQSGNMMALQLQNNKENILMELIDLSGKQLVFQILDKERQSFEISLPQIPTSVYILKLSSNYKTGTHKIFLQ